MVTNVETTSVEENSATETHPEVESATDATPVPESESNPTPAAPVKVDVASQATSEEGAQSATVV